MKRFFTKKTGKITGKDIIKFLEVNEGVNASHWSGEWLDVYYHIRGDKHINYELVIPEGYTEIFLADQNTGYPKEMMVWNDDDESVAVKRLVIGEDNGLFVARVENDTIISYYGWGHAKDIPPKEEEKEEKESDVTIDDVAKSISAVLTIIKKYFE